MAFHNKEYKMATIYPVSVWKDSKTLHFNTPLRMCWTGFSILVTHFWDSCYLQTQDKHLKDSKMWSNHTQLRMATISVLEWAEAEKGGVYSVARFHFTPLFICSSKQVKSMISKALWFSICQCHFCQCPRRVN